MKYQPIIVQDETQSRDYKFGFNHQNRFYVAFKYVVSPSRGSKVFSCDHLFAGEDSCERGARGVL